jgi:hypothetical protein
VAKDVANIQWRGRVGGCIRISEEEFKGKKGKSIGFVDSVTKV